MSPRADLSPSEVWFADFLEAITLAGRWRAAARITPAAADALRRAAQRKSAQAQQIIEENLRRGVL